MDTTSHYYYAKGEKLYINMDNVTHIVQAPFDGNEITMDIHFVGKNIVVLKGEDVLSFKEYLDRFAYYS